jgi:hypothetical protein
MHLSRTSRIDRQATWHVDLSNSRKELTDSKPVWPFAAVFYGPVDVGVQDKLDAARYEATFKPGKRTTRDQQMVE